ncbi:MAG TPA: DUF885 domain-containing protein [Candidatus Baltobacteraceae bacterium]|nr:DUF885 domain-containing protein [Candidatus Baltobacteraceae bacterium]
MKFLSVVVLIPAVLVSAHFAVAQNATAAKSSSDSATRELREFLAKDWKYWMHEYPEAATNFGYPGENARWSDYSPASIAARNEHLKEALSQLKAIPRAELPASEQLNYDLYDELLQTAVDGLRFHDDAFPIPSVFPGNLYVPITQVEGPLQDIPNTIAMMPATAPAQYQDILARLNGIPTVIDQTIDMMKGGMAHGWTAPKITMRDVPKQAESQVVSDPLASPLLAAFKNYPASFTAEQKADFTRRAEAAYREKVAPSFRKLADFLTQTYIPACRDTISISDIPDGAAYYKYLVRWHTTTDMTPQQIHQIGLDLVKQTRNQMDELIKQTGFQGSFGDFVKFINADPRFKFTSKDDMLLHYRATAKRADPELEHLFGKLPRLPYGVRAVPDAVAPSQTEAYYEQGAPDAARPGYLYVNAYDLPSRPTWDMEDLILHEGVPGHHLQISLAEEMQGVPEFRKQIGYTAFIEGWALYAETLGPEMGFYTDPYQKFGFLSAVMWRAVRLVVDTGIHSMGWSRDQAIQYFEETTGQPHLNSVVEIDRYIVWPGQALGYMIGRLQIQQLRQDAEKQLGDRFDIRAFHDAIVDQGAMPMDMLESRTKEWIAEQKAKTPAG